VWSPTAVPASLATRTPRCPTSVCPPVGPGARMVAAQPRDTANAIPAMWSQTPASRTPVDPSAGSSASTPSAWHRKSASACRATDFWPIAALNANRFAPRDVVPARNALGRTPCSAPGRCDCHEGFEKLSPHRCSPTCQPGCGRNSRCTAPDTCACDAGYVFVNGSTTECEPFCPRSCRNGICSSPGVCTCLDGYQVGTEIILLIYKPMI